MKTPGRPNVSQVPPERGPHGYRGRAARCTGGLRSPAANSGRNDIGARLSVGSHLRCSPVLLHDAPPPFFPQSAAGTDAIWGRKGPGVGGGIVQHGDPVVVGHIRFAQCRLWTSVVRTRTARRAARATGFRTIGGYIFHPAFACGEGQAVSTPSSASIRATISRNFR